jgi:hypothetical protein
MTLMLSHQDEVLLKLKLLDMQIQLLTAAGNLLVNRQKKLEGERTRTQLSSTDSEDQLEIPGAAGRRRRRRRMWVRPWLLRRPLYGQYEKLMAELTAEDVTGFKNFMRMEPDLFHEVLARVGPRITKQDTFWRRALEPGLKLAITLRYLGTGNSYMSLQYGFRVAFNTISILVIEVCQAIIDEYSAEVMRCPVTPEAWKEVANGFYNRWNLPHCVGAIDGKHIAMRCPRKSGSLFFNYKGFFSVVLLAVVDAEYKFLYVDIGASGSGSDAGVFSQTELKEALENGTIGLPEPDNLPNDDQPVPYFLVGDDAFGLQTWMMKPLPHRNMTIEDRIFNYRLSRARRVVENAFGLLAARFRCLLTTMPQSAERVCTITLACCVLHNLLRLKYPTLDVNAVDQDNPDTNDIIPGAWREGANLPDMGDVFRGNTNRAAKEMRQYLVKYINSEAGSVPWQQDKI